MRPAVFIVLAVLIAALWAFDTYEYDGHYRAAALESTKHLADKIENQVDDCWETTTVESRVRSKREEKYVEEFRRGPTRNSHVCWIGSCDDSPKFFPQSCAFSYLL